MRVDEDVPRPIKRGRKPASSPEAVREVAYRLFLERGYESTSVEDIADAVGIGRTTFFRYYETKPDLIWRDFRSNRERLKSLLAEAPAGAPVALAVEECLDEAFVFRMHQGRTMRARWLIIGRSAELTIGLERERLAFAKAIAGFVAPRLTDAAPDSLPEVIARAMLAAAMHAVRDWAEHDPDRPLPVDGVRRQTRPVADAFQSYLDATGLAR